MNIPNLEVILTCLTVLLIIKKLLTFVVPFEQPTDRQLMVQGNLKTKLRENSSSHKIEMWTVVLCKQLIDSKIRKMPVDIFEYHPKLSFVIAALPCLGRDQ